LDESAKIVGDNRVEDLKNAKSKLLNEIARVTDEIERLPASRLNTGASRSSTLSRLEDPGFRNSGWRSNRSDFSRGGTAVSRLSTAKTSKTKPYDSRFGILNGKSKTFKGKKISGLDSARGTRAPYAVGKPHNKPDLIAPRIDEEGEEEYY